MPVPGKDIAVLRCPVCFGREVDVLLLADGHGYYCVKCSFTGTEADVRSAYRDLQKKYRNIETRISFDQLEAI